jgi:translocation and assembly module TamB
VTKATADFSQVDSFLPYLNVEAHGRVSQYNIMLNLMGPVEHMRLILKSQPPLSRQQIISLLTLRNTGKNSSSISSEDVSSLVGAGLRMTLNSLGITSELERFLSLDMLNITTGTLDSSNRITAENKNYYNIEMGKYLFNDFMITAAFGLNHGDNRVGMRYDLGTHFGLNAWHTSDGSTFGGAMYRYSF